MTERLTTKTAATYRVARGPHGTQVAEEAQRLYAEFLEDTDDGFSQTTVWDFHFAADRIVTLEEAVRDRDKRIVELHDDVTHLRGEVEGYSSDARYWENKQKTDTA
jgi:chitodextrinase